VFDDEDIEHPTWRYVCGCGVSGPKAENLALSLEHWNILQKP
jgi:hypothetical protein